MTTIESKSKLKSRPRLGLFTPALLSLSLIFACGNLKPAATTDGGEPIRPIEEFSGDATTQGGTKISASRTAQTPGRR